MFSKIKPANIDVVILCGGLGKRLRLVINDRPKALAEISKQPFIDILIRYIAGFGFRRFVLCIGYMGDRIKEHFVKNPFSSLEIIFSEEDRPLGTGGALKKAESYLRDGSPFLALNGDSLCRLDLMKFLDFHIAKRAVVSIAIIHAKKKKGYGAVTLRRDGRVVEFREKSCRKDDCFINAGIYFMEKDVLSLIPKDREFSLEYELFPSLVNNNFYGYPIDGEEFIDIGTPENYKRAGRLMADKY